MPTLTARTAEGVFVRSFLCQWIVIGLTGAQVIDGRLTGIGRLHDNRLSNRVTIALHESDNRSSEIPLASETGSSVLHKG
jgi:hypothetical protein